MPRLWQLTPRPTTDRPGHFVARWNSVALFFNLTASNRPAGYTDVTSADARQWLDEGTQPTTTRISEYTTHYWATLSQGQFAFGMNTPRDPAGTPLVPTIDMPTTDQIPELIRRCLRANAEACWRAGGALTKDGRRWIPSVVLLHTWDEGAWAGGGLSVSAGGHDYDVNVITHLNYRAAEMGFHVLAGRPEREARNFWGTLCHEHAHNFLEYGDLYGPTGTTGYWDILGDNSPPGCMSEVSSVHKERIGWLNYVETVRGPSVRRRTMRLRPFTTTGEAIKVVPDPEHDPQQYFVLEYRRSTGSETWRPDGGLTQQGLFICHVNNRLDGPPSNLLREAPYFDPEFASFTDQGGAAWTGWNYLNGILYPQPGNNAFTPASRPSSDLYGRASGLSITNIRTDGDAVTFELEIDARHTAGWTTGPRDRATAGRFSPESRASGMELFMRNDTTASLLQMREAQWTVKRTHHLGAGQWSFGRDDWEVAADFDGDGLDELFVRSAGSAAILKWGRYGFDTVALGTTRIGGWALGADNTSLAGDLDGDGRAELILRSPQWIGVGRLAAGQIQMASIQNGAIGTWTLSGSDVLDIGRFTGDRRGILVRRGNELGLLEWDAAGSRLTLRAHVRVRLGDWALDSTADKVCIGDFDGDGRDEIFIRSRRWAGLFEWDGSRLVQRFIRQNDLANRRSDVEPRTLALRDSDRCTTGRFWTDRDGVLHRADDGLAILTWESSTNQMMLRRFIEPPSRGDWRMGRDEKIVVGDFHRIGDESTLIVEDNYRPSAVNIITDRISDVFIHDQNRTAMVGFNPATDYGREQHELGLTWHNPREIMAGRPGAVQRGWRSHGNLISSSPVVGTNMDGRLELLARGADGRMEHVFQGAASQGFVDWQRYPAPPMRGDPRFVRNNDGRLEIFSRGVDNAIWHLWQTAPNSGWSGWESLGGTLTSDPSVGVNADGRLEVFGRGLDNALWRKNQFFASGAWNAIWYSLGGTITSEPVVGRNADGRLEVFARGTDNALWHIWQLTPGGAWSSWASLGGVIEQPTVGSNADGRLEVFTRGTDGALWHIWQNTPNGGWASWASRGGTIAPGAAPAVIRSARGSLEVVARSPANTVVYLSQAGGWSGGWVNLGGETDIDPTIAENADGRLEVFCRGADQRLEHRWQVSRGGAWNG